ERQLDLDRLATAGAGVIAGDRATEPRRLHAYDRIGLRIELLVAPERLDRDGVALDAIAFAAQLCLDHVAQEGGKLRRAAKHVARHDAIERAARFVGAGSADGIPTMFSHRHRVVTSPTPREPCTRRVCILNLARRRATSRSATQPCSNAT